MTKFEKVPMPEAGVTIVRSSGYPYVYYYTEIFRNKNGQADNKRISIGKFSEEDNMLIPNKNYFDVFNITLTRSDHIELSDDLRFGNHILFDKITKDLGLDKIMEEVFLDNDKKILTVVAFLLNYSSKMIYINDWCEENYTYNDLIIDSRRTSEYFKNLITRKEKNLFFNKWTTKNNKDEYVAYDVTSRSSYSTNNELVEYGYNRDGENLPQINIGTFFGEKSKMPIYYTTYSGSITDTTHLPFMMQEAKELNLIVSKFVLDTGFYSEKNIIYMCDEQLKFIICMRRINIVKDIIRNIREVQSSEHYILTHEIYAHSYKNKYKDYDCKIHIFFDSNKIASEELQFYEKIKVLENELEILEEMNERSYKKYSPYFDIEVKDDKSFTYVKNYDKINIEHKLIGYFACVTNDLDLTSEEVIDIYRKKDIVEKHFDNLKDFADLDRIGTHSLKTSEGKEFVGFISLIYKMYIENKASKYIKENKYTIEKLLFELSKIKIITVNGNTRLLQPITNNQKNILELFDISEKDIMDAIKEL